MTISAADGKRAIYTGLHQSNIEFGERRFKFARAWKSQFSDLLR